MSYAVTALATNRAIGQRGVTITVPARQPTVRPVIHSIRAVGEDWSTELGTVGSVGPSALRLSVNGLGTFVFGFAFSLAVLALIPAIQGFNPVVVTSGSMAPALQVGDVVVTQPHSDPLAVGSVIVFESGEQSRIHRISALDAGGYETKGDANPSADSGVVSPDDVEGVAVMLVPFIGLPKVWLGTGQWFRLVVATIGLIAACWVSPRRWLATGVVSARPAGSGAR